MLGVNARVNGGEVIAVDGRKDRYCIKFDRGVVGWYGCDELVRNGVVEHGEVEDHLELAECVARMG